MSRDVSVVGPLNIDLLITGQGPPNWEALPTWDGPADMEMTAAGSVGYTVQNLARLGLEVCVSSCLPDDPLGGFIEDTLRRLHVDTSAIRMVPNTLGGIGVYMLLFGSRKRPLMYRLPTHELWPASFSSAEFEQLLDARLLHCGGYLHYQQAWHGGTRDLFQEARRRGLRTAMDPQFPLYPMDPPWGVALEDVLPYVDLLFVDETEACKITALSDLDAAGSALLAAGAGRVIIKQGADGATLYQQESRHHQPAIHIGEVVDTIGAGDAFDSGVIFGWLQGWSWPQSLLFGAVVAGFTVTGVGGTQKMPDRATALEEFNRRMLMESLDDPSA
ncbi:MAG: carbohydrate kinase family protein [Aggregatilineales bacterium]